MKKTLAIILAILMIVSVSLIATGCNSNSIKQALSGKEPSSIEDENNENGIVGGWTKTESPVITDEFKAVFDKATNALTGMDYEPVAYIASQVVAGRNHLVLCKATATVPNAKTNYSLVYIYEDLEGNAKITEMVDSDIEAIVSKDLDGGWTEAESPVLTEEVKKVLEKATETLTGAELHPVAFLGSQAVAGNNYAILCEQVPSYPGMNSDAEYVVVTVYADLKGNAEITDVKEFAPADSSDIEGESATSSADDNN